MYLAYNIFLVIAFSLAVPLLAFRMIRNRKYRRSFQQRLGLAKIPYSSSPDAPAPIWIHALSVGETLSAVPLVKALARSHPRIPIVFSTSTETGQDTAVKNVGELAQMVFYFPLDLRHGVRKSLESVRPRLFVLVETDLWPNFLRHLKEHGVPALLVNGRMSEQSFRFYRFFGFFFKHVLSCFDVMGMQAEVYAQRMLKMGAERDRVFVGGNLKFDQDHRLVSEDRIHDLCRSFGWSPEEKRILVAGSTHAGEEEIIFLAFKKLLGSFNNAVLILAPRNPERFEKVKELGLKMGLACRKRSEPPRPGVNAVIVDTMGELPVLYALGESAFVGGSLVAQGGHNLLEPAAQKKPIIFGPHMEDFAEMARLVLEAGGGIKVSDMASLHNAWLRHLSNPESAAEMGRRAYEIWQSSRGALGNYLSRIERYLA